MASLQNFNLLQDSFDCDSPQYKLCLCVDYLFCELACFKALLQQLFLFLYVSIITHYVVLQDGLKYKIKHNPTHLKLNKAQCHYINRHAVQFYRILKFSNMYTLHEYEYIFFLILKTFIYLFGEKIQKKSCFKCW